jgi:transposase
VERRKGKKQKLFKLCAGIERKKEIYLARIPNDTKEHITYKRVFSIDFNDALLYYYSPVFFEDFFSFLKGSYKKIHVDLKYVLFCFSKTDGDEPFVPMISPL